MKRILAIAAALCFLTSAGCGNVDPLTDASETEIISEETTDVTTEATTDTMTENESSSEDENDEYELYSDPRFIEISPETAVYKLIEDSVDKNGEPYFKEERYYNKYDDILSSEITFYKSGSSTKYENSYTYDDNGNIVYALYKICNDVDSVEYSSNVYESKYEYNENGDVIYSEELLNGKITNRSTCEYDEKNNTTHSIYLTYSEEAPDEVINEQIEYYTYTYDENEKLIHVTLTDGNGDTSYKRNYEYDENGFLISCFTDYTADSQKEEEIYTLNEFGQNVLIESNKYGYDGELKSESTIKFEYDPVTHMPVYKENTMLDYEYGYNNINKRYFDEYGDNHKSEYTHFGDGYTTETVTSSEKEYLVSDDITEMFKAWNKIQNDRSIAKKLSKLSNREKEADDDTTVTEEVTDVTEVETTAAETEETTAEPDTPLTVKGSLNPPDGTE